MKYCYLNQNKIEKNFAPDQSCTTPANKTNLQIFWDLLGKTSRLHLSAKTWGQKEVSTQIGKAEVVVKPSGPKTLIFYEKGTWLNDPWDGMRFSNIFRWRYDPQKALVSLEHLRYGIVDPIFLFDLTLSSYNCLQSIDPHLCANDAYTGKIVWNQDEIDFSCSVLGPKKNSILTYQYELTTTVSKNDSEYKKENQVE